MTSIYSRSVVVTAVDVGDGKNKISPYPHRHLDADDQRAHSLTDWWTS